jgi:tRNA nucleotidyltransferase (CCA-adding enzyme)
VKKYNFAELLKRSLVKDRFKFLHLIADEATQRGLPLYIIGGSVRDLLLGSVINDFDLTVEGDAIALARALAKRHGGKVTAHSKFGTAKWFLPVHLLTQEASSDALDLVSARSETYEYPAALPTVKLGSLDDDIRRRDFTINALALRLDGDHFGELVDVLNGQTDLERGTIRVLHPKSFIDDPTRMYRAVRYEQRYGFEIAPDTLALIPEARSLVEKLSAQRIRHELDLILEDAGTASMLKRLNELGLLEPIHPALAFDESAYVRLSGLPAFREIQSLSPWNADSMSRVNKPDLGWLLWLMPLSRAEIESLNIRLNFTADLQDSLLAVSALYAERNSLLGLQPSQYVERLESIPEDAIEALYFVSPDEISKDVFFKYLTEWRHVKVRINGDDLKKLGLEPGPKYALILRQLRNAWLDGKVKTEEEEKQLLDIFLKKEGLV